MTLGSGRPNDVFETSRDAKTMHDKTAQKLCKTKRLMTTSVVRLNVEVRLSTVRLNAEVRLNDEI